MFTVILSEEAELDLEDVFDYYSEISKELGARFIKNFDDCLLQLENIPFFQIRYNQIRIRKVKVFPILLHYILLEDSKTVVIYGVRFGRENPEKRIQHH